MILFAPASSVLPVDCSGVFQQSCVIAFYSPACPL